MAGHIREVSSGFLMLCLLLCQEPSESYNICVDLLITARAATVGRHDAGVGREGRKGGKV